MHITVYLLFIVCLIVVQTFYPTPILSLVHLVRHLLRIPRELDAYQYANVPEFGTRDMVHGSPPSARIMLLWFGKMEAAGC